jgi:steroid delta-isomerase-like uncharacterized protein
VNELFDHFESAWSSGDPGAFATSCAPDVHYEDPLLRDPLDSPAAIGGHAQRLWSGFPDVRLERTGERLTNGRYVCSPVKVLGTHRNDLEGIPPTGRFLVVHVVFYAELDPPAERLWRIRAFFDVYDAAQQLGVLPRHGTVGERALLMLRGFGLNR